MDIYYLYRFIPIILFFHPYYLARRNRNRVATFICGLYLVSSIGSLFVSEKYLFWHDFKSDSLFGFFTYAIFNLPLLYASRAITPFDDLSEFRLNSITRFFIFFLGLGALYSFLYQFPFVLRAMSYRAIEVRAMDEAILPQSIFTTLAVGFPMFLFVYIFLFYLSIIKRWSIVAKLLMLLGAIDFILNVLTFSGRDGFVFFFLAFIFGYLLFQPHFTKRTKKLIVLIGLGILVLGIITITIITLDRFAQVGNNDVEFAFQVGVLNYFSMQPFAYNDLLKFHDSFSYGKGNFPLFYSWFFEMENTRRDISMPYMYNFKGYVGSFYQNGGFGYSLIIIFLLYLFFKKLRTIHKYHFLYRFSLLSFYLFFMSSGLFYFRLGNKGGNLFILMSVIMMYLFKYMNKNRIKF